ncbi:MAG TPA: transcription termination factor Rho [Opitutae bacterium]|nr:transcription termination factor Rho [Opitutae bacterium]HCY58166.1 transcription termination factor Rho [Opitutae bacterium]
MPAAPLREEVIDLLLDCCLEQKVPVQVSGIIQVMEDGHGFLLQEKENYRLKSQSPFVPAPLIKKYGIKTGQCVQGFVRSKMDGATCPLLLQIEKIMDGDPEEASRVTPFTELVPYYPLERIFLETDEKVEWDNVSMRVVDLVSPIGFGQRGLIVAPPRTGKTVLQQGIARALRVNNPKAHLIVLLVDERPEEVTDFRRQVPDAEVIASTFDESAESHVHAAEIVIEKARRMVEHEQDVVILLDSITRLARAYNATMPNSGKILSGGVEATALQRPKRFFGSARNIEGGGSLTILGTALVETGSKMDEVIFEEFKGTGNMELHLDRELSNKRIFPALDFEKSGTRKEELLYHAEELTKIYSLRRSLKGVPPAEAMEMFIQRVRKTKNNPEFLVGLGR